MLYCSALLFVLVLGESRIGLVEEHNRVLVHLINATKHGLPTEHVTLIHFDSHADMAVSRYFPRSLLAAFEAFPKDIVEATEINNWVTAAWLLGIVDRMVFVEPPWGCEFRPVEHRQLVFYAGTVEGHFKLDILTAQGERVSEKYWHTVDDGTLPEAMDHFADHSQMADKHRVEVLIVPFEELLSSRELAAFVQRTSGPVYLDIDLDCFSTESPSTVDVLQTLRIPLRFQQLLGDLYHGRLPNHTFSVSWWRQHLRGWQEQCPQLGPVMDQGEQRLAKGKASEDAIVFPHALPEFLPEVDPKGIVALVIQEFPLEVDDRIGGLLQPFASNLEALVAESDRASVARQLFHAIRNPLHMSTADEIAVMLGAVECFLSQFSRTTHARTQTPPVNVTVNFVTLARSPYYTPTHSLKDIECGVLAMLRRLFPEISHIYHENSLEPDYAKCELGYQFEGVGSLGTDDFREERSERSVSTPVEVVVANSSPEPLVMLWRHSHSGEWEDMFKVGAYSVDGENWMNPHGHTLGARTEDGVHVASFTVDAERGHTQLWKITTGEVDAALKGHTGPRHRDI